MASASGAYGNRFQIGRVISNAVDVVGKNFALCAGLSLVIVGVPQMLFRWLILAPLSMTVGGVPNPALMTGYGGYFALLGLINIVLSSFMAAALVRAAIEHLSGRKPVIGECLSTALRLTLPVIGMSIVIGIAAGIGFILLIVPGVILLLGWAVAIPVLVQERRGVFDSMSRSRDLTRGTKWALLGVYLVLLVATWVIQAFVGLVIVSLGALVGAIVTGIVTALYAAVSACVSASAYVELREVKEGTSVSELAEVFA